MPAPALRLGTVIGIRRHRPVIGLVSERRAESAGTLPGSEQEVRMATIGIDIGGHTHVAARCREGQAQADRKILRLTQSRAGFAALDAWLAAEPEPIERVVMESSGHYWMALAAHLRRSGVPVAVVNPLAARYFAKAGSNAPSPIRPMPGASPRWPCATAHQHAILSPESSCASQLASR